jgi:hypothetical protein
MGPYVGAPKKPYEIDEISSIQYSPVEGLQQSHGAEEENRNKIEEDVICAELIKNK